MEKHQIGKLATTDRPADTAIGICKVMNATKNPFKNNRCQVFDLARPVRAILHTQSVANAYPLTPLKQQPTPYDFPPRRDVRNFP